MQRIKVPKINVDIEKLIEEVQKNPAFASYKVTENNLNDCLLYLEEIGNCRNCEALSDCKNHQVGYCYNFDKITGEFKLSKCRFKKQYDIKNNQNDLIETLYMPKNLQEASIDDFKLDTKERVEALKQINNFLNNYRKDKLNKGLFLYGNYQTGKTFLLAALQKELSKKNVNSLLIYFPDLIRELKNSLGTPRFEQLINNLKEIDVLMLDDLGSETMTTWLRDEVIGPVLNYRLEADKTLFVTSNLTIEQLKTHFKLSNDPIEKTKSERIINRLFRLTDLFNMGNVPYRG